MDLRDIPSVDYSEYEERHEVTMEEDEDATDLPPLRSLLAPSRLIPSASYTTSTTCDTATTTSAAAAAGAAAVARAAGAGAGESSTTTTAMGRHDQVCIH